MLVLGGAALLTPRFELFCFDRESLDLKWRWDSGSGYTHDYVDPTYWNGYYIVLCSDPSYDCAMFILDANGQLVIKRVMDGGWATIGGTLLIVNNVLYLRQSERMVATYDMLKILDPSVPDADCLLFDTEYPGGWGIASTIVADDNRYYLGTIENGRIAFEARNLSDNTLVWTAKLDPLFIRIDPITLYKGRLYVPADYGGVYCIDPATGGVVWETDLRPSGQSSINLTAQGCIVDDAWYCQPGATVSEIDALDLGSGQIVAHVPILTTRGTFNCFFEDGFIYSTDDLKLVKIGLTKK